MKIVSILAIVLSMVITHSHAQENSFFVFNTGIKSGGYKTLSEQAQLLKSLGYDGVEKSGTEGFFEMQKEFEKQGLKIFTNYIKVDLDNEEQPYDPELLNLFKLMEGKNTMVWLYLVSNKYKPSTSENDSRAVKILRELAQKANKYGVKIMVYPHLNFWVENAEDAIRICEKVDRKNVGMTFNLCHFLAYSHREGIDPLLAFPDLAQKAYPHLFAISLNGADINPKDEKYIWDSFIKPLGEGNYDTYSYLKTFLKLGFDGPVGLQTYGIDQNSDIHLKKSMETWKLYKWKYASGK